MGGRALRARIKETTIDRPNAAPRPKVARLVRPSPEHDDKSGDRQRVGIQSLGRAFAILEQIARHRQGIGLADLSKRVGLHNSTTFHLAKTMVALGYIRQDQDTKRYRARPARPCMSPCASATPSW